MLAGLRSRCTTPRSCASSSAAATSAPSGDDVLLRERPAGDALRQRLARHVLHDQEVDPVAAVEIVDRGDVRVVQPGQRLRFTPEPPPCRVVAERAGRQHFEGDVAIEVLVAGAVDLAHPTGAELGGDSVVSEGLANHGESPHLHERVRSCRSFLRQGADPSPGGTGRRCPWASPGRRRRRARSARWESGGPAAVRAACPRPRSSDGTRRARRPSRRPGRCRRSSCPGPSSRRDPGARFHSAACGSCCCWSCRRSGSVRCSCSRRDGTPPGSGEVPAGSGFTQPKSITSFAGRPQT